MTEVSTPGLYLIAEYHVGEPEDHLEFLLATQKEYVGICTWGMAGCEGLGIIAQSHGEVVWVAMWHADGGLIESRVENAFKCIRKKIGWNHDGLTYEIILSSGNFDADDRLRRLKEEAWSTKYLDGRAPSEVHLIEKVGGADSAFAVSLKGEWGKLVDVVSPPLYNRAPQKQVLVRVSLGKNLNP